VQRKAGDADTVVSPFFQEPPRLRKGRIYKRAYFRVNREEAVPARISLF
jgi:hypothetical protein